MQVKSLKHLSFKSMLHCLKSIIKTAPDNREQSKITYPLDDIVVSAFACMFMQDPSLLAFQKRLEDYEQRTNLETVFGVKAIPKDSQLRSELDKLDPEYLAAVFRELFLRLQRGKHLEQYQFLDKNYVILLDATQYFCSETIHCDSCLYTTNDEDEIVRHNHKMLQPALVHPDIKQVIPLMPEEIKNTDGKTKQDCEYKAAMRMLDRLRREHPQLKITLVADGLYSKQSMVEAVKAKNMHFIFVAKPKDHKAMMEYVERSDELQEVRWVKDEQTYTCQWLNDVPIRESEDALSVNFFSLIVTKLDENGKEKITYRNSWVTNIEINKDNVYDLAKAGRARWKVENECFNTLKNQGYCIEHNYGHGKQNLCFNFYLLILLAFSFHQIFELTEPAYQECQKKAGTKCYLWDYLRSLFRFFIMESWEAMLQNFLDRKVISSKERFRLAKEARKNSLKQM